MGSQYIHVQILIEAGWSMVAFDHSARQAENYGFIMLYFCIMHVIITLIMATLIKGIFWELYLCVELIHKEIDQK